ncbi:hypothetical protein JCM8097_004932 [Rhodosporidiobolus ruineniae]
MPFPLLLRASLRPSTRLAHRTALTPATHFYSLALAMPSTATSPSSPAGTSSPSSSGLRQRNHSGHSHSHGGHGHSHGVEETAALSSAVSSLRNPSSLDPGSRITLVGLVSNIGLTVVKGAAGFLLASSALLADAAHSGSDLIADVVTLVSYRVGKWEPSRRYPYGYGKFESLGSLVVSFLLFATAAGIGLHSYHHLLLSLSTIPSIPPDLLASLDFLPHGHVHGPELTSDHSHSHSHSSDSSSGEGIVDARAMYFAAASILVKEYLYRATLKVAKSTHSNVLLANAYHHRSDALGSLVALIAIGAARVGYPMLDPIGGLVVTGMIAKQGFDVGKEALGGLVDQVTDPELPRTVHRAVSELRDPRLPPLREVGSARLLPSEAEEAAKNPLHSHAHEHDHRHSHEHEHEHEHGEDSTASSLPILSIPSIRIFASGPSLLIDILVALPPSLTLAQANAIERQVAERVKLRVGRERVREVVVRMRAKGEDGEGAEAEAGEGEKKAQ